MMMKRALAIAAVALTVTAAPQQPASAPAPAAPPEAAATAAAPGTYVGVASCANSACHGSTQPLKTSRVLQNEYFTWLNSDRHAHAYNVLFNSKSKQIVRNMHLRGVPERETLCLDCHSSNVPSKLIAGHVDLEDGVQCETCHGPAGGWRNEHSEPGWTHEQSVARGMTDLRRTTVRASSCLGCHMGEARREVDHDLIAAGHPVLAFELDNYTETMPSHWNRKPDTHGVPAWATGQIVAFRDSLSNLSRHARGSKWPEFSEMSCLDCHHSFNDAARQRRGWAGRPGLPAWSPQHYAVLRLIVGVTSPEVRNGLDAGVQDLSASVARFTDGSTVAANADRVREMVDTVVNNVTAKRWSDGDTRALIRAVVDDTTFAAHSDAQSAEQVALALQSLSSDLTRRNPRLLRSELTKSIDDLFSILEKRGDFDAAQFATKLARVRAAL
jgi:hypothetical protein